MNSQQTDFLAKPLYQLLGALFIILGSLASHAQAAPYKTMQMLPGEQRPLLTKYSVKRSAIGKPEVATLKVLNSREFLITAKQTGSTQLLLWQNSSTPTVIQIDVIPPVSKHTRAGVNITPHGNRVQLEGKTHSLSQHNQLLSSVGESAIDTTVQQGAIQVQTDVKSWSTAVPISNN